MSLNIAFHHVDVSVRVGSQKVDHRNYTNELE